MMRVHCKSCNNKYDFQYVCPDCNMPFCEEDNEQARGGLMAHSITVDRKFIDHAEKITKLDTKVDDLKKELNALKARINACKNCSG